MEDKSVEELKSIAYDQLVIQQQAQRNLQIIEQELANRQQQPKEKTKK
jgi:hypothetical protein